MYILVFCVLFLIQVTCHIRNAYQFPPYYVMVFCFPFPPRPLDQSVTQLASSKKAAKMMAVVLVFVLALVTKSMEVAGQSCGPCLCSSGLISCTGRELGKIPNINVAIRGEFKTMDLRYNNIVYIDIKLLEGLTMVDMRNNPIKCTDLVYRLGRCIGQQLCIKTDCDKNPNDGVTASPWPTSKKELIGRVQESTVAIVNMVVTVLAYIVSAIMLYMLRRLLRRMFINIDDIRRRITRMAPWTRPRTDLPQLPQRERAPFNERGRY